MENKEKTNSGISLKLATGFAITVVLTVFPLLLLAWMMESGEPGLFFGTFTYVLSGQLFASGWDRIHAGGSLDQPTIGKWYFWFTVFTIVNLPYMLAVKIVCVHRSKLRHWIFVIGLTVLCLFLLCLLTIPFYWLVQYIDAMGTTVKRIEGIVYGIGGYATVLLFYAWAVRFRKENTLQGSKFSRATS